MAEDLEKDIFSEDEQRAAVESIFKAASLGIIISGADGVIRQANPYAHRLLGYEIGDLVGRKIEALIPTNLRAKHVEHRESFNENPKTRAMGLGIDLFALKKDGTLFPVEISLTHYERKGKKEIVSFVSDITERKKIEENLKTLNVTLERKVEERTSELSQAFMELQKTNENLQEEIERRKKAEQEAQEALESERELSELKSRFVSMASHEFRTPLSAILTSVSLIGRYRLPTDEEKRQKHIHTIKASVHSLTNILNDFLSLDKLEKGKVEYSPSQFRLTEFAEELTAEMRDLAKPGQRILYDHRGENDPILLDKHLLRSVLINLLSNAIKYSGEGQDIHLSTEMGLSTLTLVVRDYGIGVPKPEQKHLFETFFRAKNVTSIQGTDLGLNIVKRCLDLMDGMIQFTSEENEGSVFKIILPKAKEG